MRIVLSDFISLDGVVQALGGKEEDNEGGFENGGWSMRATDGAFQRLFAKDLGCRAARRAFERVEYLQTPPYDLVLDGWTCARLVDAYEYSDSRCRRNGSTASIRFQAGS